MQGFFDKMRSGVTEKAMEATIRSREAIEVQQARGKIGELEGQKRKMLVEIGEAAYTMCRNSNFDQEALSRQCEPIAALEIQIQEKETEIEEIHRKAEAAIAEQKAAASASSGRPASAGGGFCPNCGAGLSGAKFCPECGTKIG